LNRRFVGVGAETESASIVGQNPRPPLISSCCAVQTLKITVGAGAVEAHQEATAAKGVKAEEEEEEDLDDWTWYADVFCWLTSQRMLLYSSIHTLNSIGSQCCGRKNSYRFLAD
jgi:hypothetical protein